MSELSTKTEDQRWSFSFREGDENYEYTIKAIENGFLLEKYRSWYEGEGDKRQYKSENTQTFYEENPLEELKKKHSEKKESKKEEKKEKESTLNALKSAMERMYALKGFIKDY